MNVMFVHVVRFLLSVHQYLECIQVDDLDQYVRLTQYIFEKTIIKKNKINWLKKNALRKEKELINFKKKKTLK